MPLVCHNNNVQPNLEIWSTFAMVNFAMIKTVNCPIRQCLKKVSFYNNIFRKWYLLGESDTQGSFRVTSPPNPKRSPPRPWPRPLLPPKVPPATLEALKEKGQNSSGKSPVTCVGMWPTTIFIMELSPATPAELFLGEVSPVMCNFSALKTTIAKLTRQRGNIVR